MASDFFEIPFCVYVKISFPHSFVSKKTRTMEKVILKCNDYSILEVGLERLYDIASFIVNENYKHHATGSIPHNINDDNALINYNGDIFKCTAVDFENTQRYGVLNDEGFIIWENDSLNIRLNSKFKNEPCLKCRLLPICNGACTQKAIDFKNRDYCIFSFDEDKKDNVILDKLENYIRNISRQ